MTLLLLIASLCGLAGYLLVSGFHDAPNAVAVAVRTRSLTPQTALKMSAFFNVAGVLLGGTWLTNYAAQPVNLPRSDIGLAMLVTAFIAHISWGVITWWLRMPSSSTQALLGGILGSTWAAHTVGLTQLSPFNHPGYALILVPMLLFPLLSFGISWVLVFPLRRLADKAYPRTVNRVSRNIMSLANSLISLTHGIQVGQRALVLFTMICLASGIENSSWLDGSVLVLCALVLAAGTMLGGWRIGYTFAHKMVHLDPFRGSVAQGTTSLVLLLSQLMLAGSVSSSHLAASSVLGSGLNQKFSSIRTGIVGKLLMTWLATIPMSFIFSATLLLAFSPLLS